MTPYFADDWLTVYQGDCREVMASMEPASVHCVVTSPPYWGLRDYGSAPVIWDGDWQCSGSGRHIRMPHHEWGADGRCTNEGCESWRGSLGLEPTPELYVRDLVQVLAEVRRVLRDDGTLWLNLGDSYAAERGGTYQPAETLAGGRHGKTAGGERVNRGRADSYSPTRNARAIGLKHKDLVGIPWRVAFALQADGWYLRSDIIWSKPNPMPESVTDRPTKSHEYLFLLSKSARYYFDADAVAETNASGEGSRLGVAGYSKRAVAMGREPSGNEKPGTVAFNGATRNIRSVWTIATQPYPGAHFATFPPKLVEPCVKAGCPQQGVVLDPFGGSGTTGMVAQHLGRRAVLIDLNGDYLVQAMRRNQQSPLGLDVA